MNTFIECFTADCLLRQYHEKIQPTHIFHKLVEHYADRISEADLRSLYKQFDNVENALALSRRRELHSAEAIFERLAAQKMEYPEYIRNGMSSMIRAAVAYYEYACGRSEEAIELLEQAIGYAMTQSVNYPFILTGALEQWRNIVVVKMRKGDLNGALADMNALISFTLMGEISGMEVEERFQFDAGGVICDRFWQMDAETHHLVLSNITRSAFNGALEYCNNDFMNAGNFFGRIIIEAAGAMQGRRVIQWAQSPIMLLHLYYSGEKERFQEGIYERFDDIRQAAPSLQWLIISNYVVLCRERGFDLESHPNYNRLFEAYSSMGFDCELLKPAAQENYSI
ncbi:MAG TPA: hypothetical protein VFE32_20590 [Puia sp.]|jgi:tetratricopeptide (TPR) repeat protein|nr:hypothetical protein [Puia sp.]